MIREINIALRLEKSETAIWQKCKSWMMFIMSWWNYLAVGVAHNGGSKIFSGEGLIRTTQGAVQYERKILVSKANCLKKHLLPRLHPRGSFVKLYLLYRWTPRSVPEGKPRLSFMTSSVPNKHFFVGGAPNDRHIEKARGEGCTRVSDRGSRVSDQYFGRR